MINNVDSSGIASAIRSIRSRDANNVTQQIRRGGATRSFQSASRPENSQGAISSSRSASSIVRDAASAKLDMKI